MRRRGRRARVEVGRLLDLVGRAYPAADVVRIREAYEWAARLHLGQRRRSGDPYITHPVAVATLAVQVGARADVVCAALLHDVLEDTPCTAAELRAEFGASVTDLVIGLTEADRDPFVADTRLDQRTRCDEVVARHPADVLVVQVLHRLHNLRTIRYIALHRQYVKARQTRQVIAPLAGRLGLRQVAGELDRLADGVLRSEPVEPGLSRSALTVAAALLPGPVRERWRQEWVGELGALPTSRQRAGFVLHILRGAPHLALVLRRPIGPGASAATRDRQGVGGSRVAGRGGVFINYRGADSTGYAALIHAQLSARLGADRVYLDSVSVPPGADYVDELLRAVGAADVMLAVIGAHWLTIAGPDGRRRIEEPTDWIRRELVTARGAGTVVIPVLTDDATLPAEADLPADLRWLARCQYRRLRYREAGTDLARLIDELVAARPEPVRHRTGRPSSWGRPHRAAAAGRAAPAATSIIRRPVGPDR